MLHVRMLGPFKVLRDGVPIPPSVWGSQQTRTILKVLLMRRGRVVPADQLLEVLWPEDNPDAGRKRLHVRISQLRRVLDPDGSSAYIVTAEGGYAFNPEVDYWLDATEFETQAEQGRRCQEDGNLPEAVTAYEAASGLYRGDFLEEDLYEDWAFAERERLRERFLTVLTELAECYAQQGRYRRAIAHCRQVLATDPCREAVYVRLMLYHYYAGEQAQALRAYERCCRVLAAELGVEPLPQTTAFYKEIQQHQVGFVDGGARYPEPVFESYLLEVPYSLGHTPFVGRGEEYARLVKSIEDVLAGHGGVVLVAGEAGLGKTRLVHEAMGYARNRGALALEGQCFELVSNLPYQPFAQALRDYVSMVDPRHLRQIPNVWLAEVAKLLPELSKDLPDVLPDAPLPPEHQKSRLFEGVAQFIIHISQEQPLLLFLDDIHWADRPTLELLHYLVRRVADEPILIVGALRSEEMGEGHPLAGLLRGIDREQLLTQLGLEPLPEEEVAELIAQASRSSYGGMLFSRRIYRETEGNPLFVIATLQNLFEEGVLYVGEEGEWSTDYDAAIVDHAELVIPPTIREVIEARLARLSEKERRLLALASVLGQEFNLDHLQWISGQSEEDLFGTLDSLLRRRLVQEGPAGRGYRFDHSKIREVVYAGLDAPQRAALHWRIGEALEEQHQTALDEVAEQLVHHFRLAGAIPRTIEYAVLAGQEALRMCAHQEADGYFQLALTTAEEADLSLARAERLAIQRGLGDAHWMAGRYEQARACYEEALSCAEAAVESDALLFKISYLDASQGMSIPSLLSRAEAFEAEIGGLRTPLTKAHHALQMGYTLFVQGVAGQAREHYQRGWEIISDLASTEKEPHAFDLAEAHRALGEAYLWWGDYDRSARDLDKALSLCQEVGDVQGTMRSRLLLGELLFCTGAWDRALTELGQVVEAAARVEHPSLLAEALFRRGYVYCDQGDWDSAEAEALRGQSITQEVEDLVGQTGVQFLLNRILIKRGEAKQALPSCQAMAAMMRGLGSGLYLCLALRYLAKALVCLGEPGEALARCEEGLELARQAGFKREIGAIQRVWGEALAQQEQWEEAAERLQASIEVLERIGSPYELGQSHHSLGRLHLGHGAPEVAGEHLGVALSLFENLGAEPDVTMTRRLMSDIAE